MNRVIRRNRIFLQIIGDGGDIVICVACRPINHALKIVVVIGIRPAAVVVAVVMQDNQQRMRRIGVVLTILVHHGLILQRPKPAATVFVAFISRARHGDDLTDRAGIWIDILHIVRPI